MPERLVELWDLPIERRQPQHRKTGFQADRDRSVASLMEELAAEFSAEQVERQVACFLAELVPRHRAGEVLAKHEKPLAHCSLRLVAAPDGVTISKELAKEIVGAYPSAYYFTVVQRIIDKYLNAEDVLDAIRDGLARQASTWNIDSCFRALYLYKKAIKQGPSSETTTALKQAIREHIDELQKSDDAQIRKAALSASKTVAVVWADDS